VAFLPDTGHLAWAGIDGWLIVEVDRPDITDPFDSAVASASWMRAAFG
jgi:hypothetical protein